MTRNKKAAFKGKNKPGGPAHQNGNATGTHKPHSKPPHPKPNTPSASASASDDDEEDLIPTSELDIATSLLTYLAEEPDVLGKKRYRELKRAGWGFGKVLAEQGAGGGAASASIQSRISHLLSISLYRPALILLFDIYVNSTPTALGSLQRWVRECDATARPEEVLSEEEEEERDEVLRCLDMILRVCGSGSGKGKGKEVVRLGEGEWKDWEVEEGEEGAGRRSEVIRRLRKWDVREYLAKSGEEGKLQEEIPLWDLIDAGSKSQERNKVEGFYPIQTTPGPLRRPPNLHPSTVHASTNSSIPFPPTSPSTPSFNISHPLIPKCSMLLNILPPQTCERIIQVANVLGWEADQASGGSAVGKNSVLAHNVVWLADEGFVGELFRRVRPFVEEQLRSGEFVQEKGKGKGKGSGSVEGKAEVNGEGKEGQEEGERTVGRVRGINRRFRIYRYGPKQVYRPHIDGAWPAAGIDPENGEYLHDSSPTEDPLWSRYTLLIYLNSDINSTPTAPTVPGATTFFLPSPSSIGTLLSCPIVPIQGAVLVFPHGDARDSLLHEGSPVGEGGWKVVIRTDLLYSAEGFGEFAQGKKRKLVPVEGEGGMDGQGPSKVAKIVGEGVRGGEKVLIPAAMGGQHAGDGVEGLGG